MKRRKTGRKIGKIARRKALRFRNTLKAEAGSVATAQDTGVARFRRERDEALEQLAATSEVLKVISASAGDMKPVFEAILANALHICNAKSSATSFSTMAKAISTQRICMRFRHRIANSGSSMAQYAQTQTPVLPAWRAQGKSATSRISKLMRPADIRPIACRHRPSRRERAQHFLAVPMLKENELIGAIVIYRQQVRPFTDKQIELVKNFAAQAVIAIENTRLLNELRESLQQQTATSDVLKVISSSPGELGPVFSAMLENAVRICSAKFGNLWLREGNNFRIGATHGAPPAYAEARRHQPVVYGSPINPLSRIIETKKLQHIIDFRTERAYIERDPGAVVMVEAAGARTVLLVPMLKENEPIGVVAIYRQDVLPFTDRQIELVENFAEQAVIAIENARLLSELQQRTDDLSVSLEQQTATSEVLGVISSSPGELTPVFNSMLVNATRICGAKFGILFLTEGDGFRSVAMQGLPPALAEERRREPVIYPDPNDPLRRLANTKQIVHIADLRQEKGYIKGYPPLRAVVDAGGGRTLLIVPMLRDNALVGAFAIYRQEVLPFTDKQIELVQNFAAQAVIAIENTRLLSELRESLQQQTATAEVLNVISRSKFDLDPILQSVVDTAAPLCRADTAVIFRLDDGIYRFATGYCVDPKYIEIERANPITPGPGTVVGRAAVRREAVQIVDAMNDPLYDRKQDAEIGQVRSMIGVPLMREGEPIGVIALARRRVEPFSDREIELVSTFADQAAIAIENVRLFESVEARTRELAKSLEDLRSTQDRLVQTQKLASLGQLTAGIAHEIKNPLNFVNNFSGVSAELIDELQDTLKGPLDDKARAEISELTDTLRGNLDKIVQHGKRADSIVKNMLLHSREGSGEHRLVDINALVEEGLNLAYHGARAEKQNFNVTLQRSFDPAAGQADVFPQDITRVLLNLISNGFYATTKRKAEAGDGYEPTLVASTRSLGDCVEIRVRDNGTGIPPEVKEKIFNPFFTTKPAGEGTGLGLSISHDVIVKQHGGSIDVETEPGAFSEFIIVLPRVGAPLTKSGGSSWNPLILVVR